MNDEMPIRTFDVVFSEVQDVPYTDEDGTSGTRVSGRETIEGHVPSVGPDGSLQILRYSGDIPWSVRLYAAGAWQSCRASLPTREDITKIEELAQREAARQRAREQNLTNSRMN